MDLATLTSDELSSEVHRVRTYLRDLLVECNLRVPISRLADELLVKIFLFSTAFDSDHLPESLSVASVGLLPSSRAVAVLPLVCHRWHSVVSSNSTLWNTITFRYWRKIPTLLKRSGRTPLTVIWGPLDRFRGFNFTDEAFEALKDLREQFARIRHLHIRFDHAYDLFRSIERLIPSTSSELEVLSLEADPSKTSKVLKLIQADNLRILHLQSAILLDLPGCAFPQLRELVLHMSSQAPSLAIFLQFLSHSSFLEHLHLICDNNTPDYSSHASSIPNRVVALPVLRTLKLVTYKDAAELFRMARYLEFPQTCKLTYFSDKPTWGSKSEAKIHYASLFRFSPRTIQVGHLELRYSDEDILVDVNADETSPVKEIRWMFSNGRIDLQRVDTGLTALMETTCTLTTLLSLKCAMRLLSSTWRGLLSTSTQLATLKLSVEAVSGFLPFFASPCSQEASSSSSDGSESPILPEKMVLPLPALKTIVLRRIGVSGQQQWFDVLSKFTNALKFRLTRGHTLGFFIIEHVRYLRWNESLDDWDDNDDDLSSEGDAQEEALLDGIRNIVKHLEIPTRDDDDDGGEEEKEVGDISDASHAGAEGEDST